MTETNPSAVTSMRGLLSAPVDIASLAAFRILFGILMTAAMLRFLANGWVQKLYLTPSFHFPFPGLEWIHPLPAGWMQAHFVGLAILGALIAMGCWYRLAITLFFFGFTYIELLDQTAYLNHYYLVTLLSGLMIFLPAHRTWSLDARRRPSLRSEVAHGWMVYLLRFQIAVVYVFSGIAKLNSDWLLNAQPLRIWLAARSDLPLIGSWLAESWVAHIASWFGAFYDLSIVFFLLHHRTRKWAFATVILFHIATGLLFHIGIFPWIMIAASTVFFPPNWSRQFATTLFNTRDRRSPDNAPTTRHPVSQPIPTVSTTTPHKYSRPFVIAVVIYMLAQIALPLRPYLLNHSHPAWTYRGFNFAWQIMVAEKTGYVEFFVTDQSHSHCARIDTRKYITARQETLMSQDPYLIRSLANHIASDLRSREGKNHRIEVEAFASLNGRPSQRIIDPNIDLATASGHQWILPLN